MLVGPDPVDHYRQPEKISLANAGWVDPVEMQRISPSRRFDRHQRNQTREHMIPRSSSQPSEYDSRHLPTAVMPLGWITARAVHVSVEALALTR